MEEDKETIQNKTEKKKKTKTIVKLCILLALVASPFAYQYFTNKPYTEPESPIPNDKPAITQQTFEDLPVGVIYEFSDEEQKQFLAFAQKMYEENKEGQPWYDGTDLVNNQDQFLITREGINRYQNEKPEDMLNEDGSLKHPDAFIGFNVSVKDNVDVYNNNIKISKNHVDIDKKINQMIYYEDYFLRENANGNYKNNIINSSWEWYALGDLRGSSDYTVGNTLIPIAVESGYTTIDNKGANMIYSFMEFSSTDYDVYELLEYFANIREYEPNVGLPTMTNMTDSYNIVNSVPDTNIVYYYPTRVVKLDDKTVIVDIRVDGGEYVGYSSKCDIFSKIMQSNTTNDHMTNWTRKEVGEDYTVFARYFISDISQYMVSELGLSPVNATSISSFRIHGNGNHHLDYDIVLNDSAKGLMKDYFIKIKETLANDDLVSTKEIMQEIAPKYGISYTDAINIWGLYMIPSVIGSSGFTLI